MLDVTNAECQISAFYAECRYAECRYAECRYAECRYAECRGAAIKLTCLRITFKHVFCVLSSLSRYSRKLRA